MFPISYLLFDIGKRIPFLQEWKCCRLSKPWWIRLQHQQKPWNWICGFTGIVIYPKYYKQWPYNLASTIDCTCLAYFDPKSMLYSKNWQFFSLFITNLKIYRKCGGFHLCTHFVFPFVHQFSSRIWVHPSFANG